MLFYEQVQDLDISFISFDTLDLREKIDQPYVLKECQHLKSCQSFSASMQSNYFRCDICNKTANNMNDIRKDVRWQVYQQFHSSVESVQIIQGILTHKYQRKKQFPELINQFQVVDKKQLFKQLADNYHKQVIQSPASQKAEITVSAFCLLDKIKITVPVRFINCKHLECYELTSILAYYKQSTNQQKKFQCHHSECFNIMDMRNLLTEFMIDMAFLRAINKAPISEFALIYNPYKQSYETEKYKQIIIDSKIKKIYDKFITNQDKQLRDLQDFQNQVLSPVSYILQCDIPQKTKQRLQKEMYKDKNFNMIDPITNELIELPIRCINCTYFNRCMDLKSFTAKYILAKKQASVVQCPLCGYNHKSLTQLFNMIYIDTNLISQIYQDQEQFKVKLFKYQGKKYLLNYFKNCQIYKKKQFLSDLWGQQNLNIQTIDHFSREITVPLILLDCPIKSVIDFQSFYDNLVEINFNLEEENFNLCMCGYCFSQPLKSYEKIMYHEAYDEALQQLRKQQILFQFNFQTQQVKITNNQ